MFLTFLDILDGFIAKIKYVCLLFYLHLIVYPGNIHILLMKLEATMSDPRQPKMPWIIPYLSVVDVEKTINIYSDVFGFEVLETSKYGSDKIVHAELRYHDMMIMCGDVNGHEKKVTTPALGGYSPAVTLYVYCDDVDALYAKVKAAGLEIVYEISDQFWGDRMFACKDPDGHAWSFGTHIAK